MISPFPSMNFDFLSFFFFFPNCSSFSFILLFLSYRTSPIILAASRYVWSSFSHFSRSFLTPSSS